MAYYLYFPFKVSSGLSPRELCTPTVLNNTISRALQMSVYADTTEHAQQLSFALKWIPDMFKMNGIYLLRPMDKLVTRLF